QVGAVALVVTASDSPPTRAGVLRQHSGRPMIFVRNASYIAAWADELEQKPLARRICSEPVVLFRDHDGRAAALVDRCCHRAAPLSRGDVVPAGLQCGYHGLTFDGSGKCVGVPEQSRIPDSLRVQTYPEEANNQH